MFFGLVQRKNSGTYITRYVSLDYEVHFGPRTANPELWRLTSLVNSSIEVTKIAPAEHCLTQATLFNSFHRLFFSSSLYPSCCPTPSPNPLKEHFTWADIAFIYPHSPYRHIVYTPKAGQMLPFLHLKFALMFGCKQEACVGVQSIIHIYSHDCVPCCMVLYLMLEVAQHGMYNILLIHRRALFLQSAINQSRRAYLAIWPEVGGGTRPAI
jgi:hypothetical protein